MWSWWVKLLPERSRQRTRGFKKLVIKDGSLVRQDICNKSSLWIEGALSGKDAQYYSNILEKRLLPVVLDALGDIWTLQQDNAQIHTAPRTKKLFWCQWYNRFTTDGFVGRSQYNRKSMKYFSKDCIQRRYNLWGYFSTGWFYNRELVQD